MMLQLTNIPNLNITVVPAVLGSALPRTLMRLLFDDTAWEVRRGAVGCFLSHMNIWEQIVSSKKGYGIVIEDDIAISCLEALETIEYPDDLDLLYLNNRMSPPGRGNSYRVISIQDILQFVETRHKKGSGTDGYLVTEQGARKLIKQISVDGYYGHIDGRLLRYSVPQSVLDAISSDSQLKRIIKDHHSKLRPPSMGILNTYAITPPMVHHLGLEGTRVHSDFVAS